jgi:hypothetical protein
MKLQCFFKFSHMRTEVNADVDNQYETGDPGSSDFAGHHRCFGCLLHLREPADLSAMQKPKQRSLHLENIQRFHNYDTRIQQAGSGWLLLSLSTPRRITTAVRAFWLVLRSVQQTHIATAELAQRQSE